MTATGDEMTGGVPPREAVAPVTVEVAGAGGVILRVRAWQPRPERAERPPFVLLHGIASTARSWDGVAARLRASGHAAFALDFRGHGLSDRPDDGYDLATFAADLASVPAALGLDRPILVGHSLGANVILAALADQNGPAGGRVAAGGVALVEGGLVGARAQFATLDECLAKLTLPQVAGMPLPRLEGYLRQSNPGWSADRLAAALAAFDVHADGTVSWRLTKPRYEALLRALWAHDVAAAWAAVRVPTLVIAADTGDAAWTAAKRAAESELSRALPYASVRWLTADHDVHTDRPDEIADLLLGTFAAI